MLKLGMLVGFGTLIKSEIANIETFPSSGDKLKR